jgi:hypothetical protein
MICKMDEQNYRHSLRDAETTSDDIVPQRIKCAFHEQGKHALCDCVIRKENEFIFIQTLYSVLS